MLMNKADEIIIEKLNSLDGLIRVNFINIKTILDKKEKTANNPAGNINSLSDQELIILRDKVSEEITSRATIKTPDLMFGWNWGEVAKFLSFDLFTLEQCYQLAKNLLETIEKKREVKNEKE